MGSSPSKRQPRDATGHVPSEGSTNQSDNQQSPSRESNGNNIDKDHKPTPEPIESKQQNADIPKPDIDSTEEETSNTNDISMGPSVNNNSGKISGTLKEKSKDSVENFQTNLNQTEGDISMDLSVTKNLLNTENGTDAGNYRNEKETIQTNVREKESMGQTNFNLKTEHVPEIDKQTIKGVQKMQTQVQEKEKRGQKNLNFKTEHETAIDKQTSKAVAKEQAQAHEKENRGQKILNVKTELTSANDNQTRKGDQEMQTQIQKDRNRGQKKINSKPTHERATNKQSRTEQAEILNSSKSEKNTQNRKQANDQGIISENEFQQKINVESETIKHKESEELKKKQDHVRMQDKLIETVTEMIKRFGGRDIQNDSLWKGQEQLYRYFETVDGPSKVQKSRKQLIKLQKELAEVRQQKAKYLNRLSEIASSRLQHNNPDIADLSDENRATKLAEKLSELYDNEWTDVYEAVKKKAKADTTDKTIALSLKEILKFCYDTCREKSQKQRSFVLRALYMNGDQDETKVPAGLGLSLTVLQKSAADASLNNLKKEIKETIRRGLKENLALKNLNVTNTPLSSYVILCTEISWYIQTQNPPLLLDFEGKENPTVLFRPYTVSGQHLSYVLWPALFLHETGPVVSKGVAQFSKEPENETDLQSDDET